MTTYPRYHVLTFSRSIVRQPRRSGDQLRTHVNIAKARRLLGYTPHTSAEDGLAQEVAWIKDIMGRDHVRI